MFLPAGRLCRLHLSLKVRTVSRRASLGKLPEERHRRWQEIGLIISQKRCKLECCDRLPHHCHGALLWRRRTRIRSQCQGGPNIFPKGIYESAARSSARRAFHESSACLFLCVESSNHFLITRAASMMALLSMPVPDGVPLVEAAYCGLLAPVATTSVTRHHNPYHSSPSTNFSSSYSLVDLRWIQFLFPTYHTKTPFISLPFGLKNILQKHVMRSLYQHLHI